MKKYIVAAVITASLLLVAGAQASCHSFGCVSRQINSLTSQLRRDTNYIAQLQVCLNEVPQSVYGDSGGTFGYVYDFGGGAPLFDTTALDITNPNTNVAGWAMYDSCNTKTTPAFATAARASRYFGPLAPPAPAMRPQRAR